MPITQYFEFAMQAGLIRGLFFTEDAELLKVPAPVNKQAHPHYHHHNHRKVRREGEKRHQNQVKKQGKVYDLTSQIPRIKQVTAPKAVDQNLYKIPPELLHQNPRRKRVLRNLWSGCLGLNCVA